MKPVALFALCIALSVMAVAQKKTPGKNTNTKSIAVPTEVNTAFKEKFTDVEKQKWNKKAGGNYVATFLSTDNVKQEVEFDDKGAYLKSKSIFSKEQVPELITTSLSKNYSDKEILEVVKYDIAGISPYYKVKINDGAKGKFLLVSEAGDVTE